MSKDLRRRITRLEQSDNQGAIRYDISDTPMEEGELPDALHYGAPLLSPVMTEAEWQAAYCGDDA